MAEVVVANQTKTTLPKEWRWARLREVCTFRHGGTPSKADELFWRGNIPWVSPKDMRSIIISDTEDHISETALTKSSACLVAKNTILAVVRSGILARKFPLAISEIDLSFNQDIKAILPNLETVDLWFLYWSLVKQESHILANGIKKGATVHSMRSGFIESLAIPLPPLSEQKRIATTLNEQMSAVERARAAAETQLEAAKALPAAYLRVVFSSPEAQNWSRRKVGDLLTELLKTGISKPTCPIAETRCLTLSAVRNGLLNLTASKPVEVNDRETHDNWVKPGAFYVVRGNGNISLVGRGACAPTEIPPRLLYPDL